MKCINMKLIDVHVSAVRVYRCIYHVVYGWGYGYIDGISNYHLMTGITDNVTTLCCRTSVDRLR